VPLSCWETMLGGYNISPLIDLLDSPELGQIAANGLKKHPVDV